MEEKITEAAKRYGFNLEFRASEILKKNHYQVALNTVNTVNELPHETDIFAWDISGLAIAAECKGAEQNSILLAIKETSNKLNSFSTENKKFKESEYTLGQFEPCENNYFFTFSGDFFKTENNGDLKKMTRNDDSNNFYKAINQIQASIISASKITFPLIQGNIVKTIIPMIITNSDIYVIDYASGPQPNVNQHKWILHKAIVSIDLCLQENAMMLSFPIININYLGDFLTKCLGYNLTTNCYCLVDGALDTQSK
ncbi:TPA: hypothetical protein JBB62_01980 [Legionella pneumophila subsp. pneumophila]|nr:hypothetical protein [Legionella pneumophila subsp. pneumophila]HAT9165934.1 hypothetical protein [Legionella pneumophila subsp. pneumophila]HDI5486215.1 hypothetical protein [Legionella pneumophila]